ncbi:MAG: hypothetical protein AB8I08_02250 [Sandaracinaceae bacterium]
MGFRVAIAALAAVLCGCMVTTDDLYVIDHNRPPPSTPCSTDVDCDDGLVCNGVERCGSVSGMCVSGDPIECTEGFAACAQSSCSEPTGACTPAPNDAACPAGFACDIERGCVTRCATPPVGECDVESGCGCPSGETCFVLGREGVCAPMDNLGEGERCNGSDGAVCAPGLTCLRSRLDGISSCQQICSSQAECWGRCQPDLVAGPERVCSTVCSLWDRNACPGSTACVLLDQGSPTVLGSGCALGGSSGQSQPCTDLPDCRPGTLCVNTSDDGLVCLTACRTRNDCPSGLRCVSFIEPLFYEGEEIGSCL